MAKTNFEQLIDLIKAKNPTAVKPLNANTLVHEAPVALEGQTKNTSIVVKGNAALGYAGTKTITYDRLDLTTQLTTLNVTLPLVLNVPNDGQANGTISSSALLPLFNAAAGIELQVEDIVVEDIVLGDNPAETDYTITMKAGGLKWLGSAAVKLVEVADDITSELANTELDGFTYAQP